MISCAPGIRSADQIHLQRVFGRQIIEVVPRPQYYNSHVSGRDGFTTPVQAIGWSKISIHARQNWGHFPIRLQQVIISIAHYAVVEIQLADLGIRVAEGVGH